jgi:hypothetical protein
MTCTHVLGLIDAGPFADYPRAHLDAAWKHARQCPTCGPVLQAAAALTTDLHVLALPAPPPDLARVVLARIAQVDQEQFAPAAATMPKTRARRNMADWSVQAAAAGGLAAAIAIATSMPAGEVPIYMASPAVGGVAASLVALRPSGTEALVLAAGLMVYVAGLFAPLAGRDRLSR